MKIKELPIIIGGLVIVVCIAILVFLTQKVNQKVLEVQGIAKDIVMMQKAREDATSLKALYSSYKDKFDLVDSVFVDLEYLKNFTKLLQDMADSQGVELALSESGTTKTADAWPSSAYQIRITGDYDDCHRFWEKLENGPWLAEFTAINLSQKSGADTMNANFTIKIYNKKDAN